MINSHKVKQSGSSVFHPCNKEADSYSEMRGKNKNGNTNNDGRE